jgi:hypothetical protein
MSAATATAANNHFVIGFHGNCIDGWMSTYIAYSALVQSGAQIAMFPMSPNQKTTWPSYASVKGANVLLLDVSVPYYARQAWMKAGARSIQIIDHHESAVEHWPAKNNPIDTSRCAAYQTWQRFYPNLAIPAWLDHVDRIDRWDNPTYEDRCVREVLNIIAHKPVEKKYDEAFHLTQMFLTHVETPQGFTDILQEGKVILEKKDAGLLELLERGSLHEFTQEYLDNWKMPAHWLGANVYIIDTTNVLLDTTEAAHLVFESYPIVQVFVNYRKKLVTRMDASQQPVQKDLYIFSARSRGFDLTSGASILKGHKTSAGASLVRGEAPVLPFVVAA